MIKNSNLAQCCFMGEGPLALYCLKFLFNKMKISAVFSTDTCILNLAKKNGTPSYRDYDDFKQYVLKINFFFGFSVNNFKIIDTSMIKKAKKCWINYHNSLLPNYRGMNACSFALLNNEREHGITWHKVSEKIDAGNILLQKKFHIDTDESELSLSLKCYEAATNSFKELLDLLNSDKIKGRKQKPNSMIYTHYSKPMAGGLINFKQEAETITREIAAFNFGQYDNTLTLSKCIINDTVFIIENAAILSSLSSNAPNQLEWVSQNKIIVHSKTNKIQLTIKELSEKKASKQLTQANKILDITGELAEKAKAIASIQKNNEPIYLSTLHSYHPANFMKPLLRNRQKRVIEYGNSDDSKTLISLIFIAISKALCFSPFSANILSSSHDAFPTPLKTLFSAHIPAIFHVSANDTVNKSVNLIKKELNSCTRNPSHASDLYYRYINLRSQQPNIWLTSPVLTHHLKSNSLVLIHDQAQRTVTLNTDIKGLLNELIAAVNTLKAHTRSKLTLADLLVLNKEI